MTTLDLIRKVAYCEKRWMQAMKRPGYRDDPFEADEKGKPFTEQDWVLYMFADSWRLLTHRYENLLDLTREASMARSLSSRDPERTIYEAPMSPGYLINRFGGNKE